MKGKPIIVLLLAAILLMACGWPQYKIVGKLDADEGPIYTVCVLNSGRCGATYYAEPIPGTGRMPPVGRTCKLVGPDRLDCGCWYADLRVSWPVPE